MYARILTLELGPNMRAAGMNLAERWLAGVATLPGFVDAHFFGDEDTGEYGVFSLWQTREDAERAGEHRPESVEEELLRQLKKPAQLRIFEVYEPRARG